MQANANIHINCDLGEGIGNDAQIMPLIDACNIACGGHTGDVHSIKRTIRLALKNEVQIGIHPSYYDPTNFGRTSLPFDADSLRATLIEQVSQFLNIAESLNAVVNHIKLHGALYNDAASNAEIAQFIIELFNEITPNLPLYCPLNSSIVKIGGIQVVTEAFADRRYTQRGQLVSRKEKGALITHPNSAWKQIEMIHTTQSVKTIEGNRIPMKGETFCVHSDSPNAQNLLQYINTKRNALS